MPDRNLGVQPVQQQTSYYCGPAVAEMVLAFLGVARPAGPATWQDQLRAYIEKNTNATRPPLTKAPESPDNPAFKEQKCELCDGEYECWATTPNVLKKLLNASQSVTTYQVSKRTTERGATDAMLDNVDSGRPAIALVEGSQHFIVIDGYRHDEAGSVSTFRRHLNGVWFCDPADGTLHYKDFSVWEGSYLYWVPCGTYADTIVVIRAKR
jgi:hypothetical protein